MHAHPGATPGLADGAGCLQKAEDEPTALPAGGQGRTRTPGTVPQFLRSVRALYTQQRHARISPRKMKCADDVYRNAHHSFIHHNPQMEIAPEVWPRGGGVGGRAGGQNAARPRSGRVWTPMPERPEARVRLRDGHDPGEKSTGTKQWPPLSRSGWPGEGTSCLKREEAEARTYPIYLHPYPLHPNCGRSGRLVQIFRKQDSKF